MLPSIKKELLEKINNCFEDILEELESSRYEPSERGAGTAPTDSAIASARKSLFNLIDELCELNIKKGDLSKIASLEEIISDIQNLSTEQFDNFDPEDFDELEEIDSFDRDNGERKYTYVNTVYKHKPTGRFICIEYQTSSNPEFGFKEFQSVSEVSKKEKVTYSWD